MRPGRPLYFGAEPRNNSEASLMSTVAGSLKRTMAVIMGRSSIGLLVVLACSKLGIAILSVAYRRTRSKRIVNSIAQRCEAEFDQAITNAVLYVGNQQVGKAGSH